MRTLLIALLAVTPALSLSAQQAARRGGGFAFQVVTPSRTPPEEIRFLPPGSEASVVLEFHPSNLSKTYRYAASSELVFFTEKQVPGEEVPVRTKVASFTPPTKDASFILLFTEGAKGTWKIEGIPQTERTLAPAAISFYNGLVTMLAADVAGKKVALRQGLTPPVSLKGLSHVPGVLRLKSYDPATNSMVEQEYETLNEGVRLVIVQPGKGSPRRLYDASVDVSPRQSYMMLIFPPEEQKRGRCRIKMLSVAPASKPEPGQP